MKRLLLGGLLATAVWAQSPTQALVEKLVTAERAAWPTLVAGASADPAELKRIAEAAQSQPLPVAQKTAQACDALGGPAGQAQLSLIRQRLRASQPADALTVAQSLLAAAPQTPGARMLLGFCLIENARYEEARVVFTEQTQATPFQELAWAELGRVNVLLNDKPAAEKAFREVLSINPDNALAKDALLNLQGTVVRIKTTPEARAHFEKGEALFATRQFPEALAEYRLAAQADPRFVRALVYSGDCHFQLGDLEAAEKCYQEALVVDPVDKQANRFLGTLWERRFDRSGETKWLEQAIAAYRKALQADPTYARAQADLERAEAKRR